MRVRMTVVVTIAAGLVLLTGCGSGNNAGVDVVSDPQDSAQLKADAEQYLNTMENLKKPGTTYVMTICQVPADIELGEHFMCTALNDDRMDGWDFKILVTPSGFQIVKGPYKSDP